LETITITLNGREVSGHPGMTILDLAQESGVDIPTLCHDPHLPPVGACRVCLVEDEHSGALLASCVTPIAPGMVISTQSPRVQERRETIIKLMLASHPDSCAVCDKGNRCQLRKIASDMGIGLVEFQRIPQLATVEEVNPFIERDLSKCILCAKCIRACQELVVEGAIDYIHRGFISKPATLNDLPLEKSECTFCGTCVALCPTGALTEKEKTYRGTTTTIVHTICPFCGCGCGICLEVKDNHLVRAKPDEDSSLNHGTLCVKGSYGYDFVHSPERLTNPMIKVNGSLEAVSWERALGLVADEFKRIKETYGPSSLAVFGSSKCTNEENYLLQRFARCVLGTNNIDNGSRLYSSASRIGLRETIGFPGTTNFLDDIEQSQTILVIGANPTSSAPLVGYAIKRAVRHRGAKLLLIDPQQTKLASWAHLWLRPKVGTDVALINGMAKVIIDEDLLNREYVATKINGFEVLTTGLRRYTLDYVAEITGVLGQDIRHAARLFAEPSRASIVYGNGMTQYVNGMGSVIALANLAMLTGNIGHKGGGIYALQRESNGQGACDMGALPDFLPGYLGLGEGQARKNFEDRWECYLPVDIGLTALEMIDQAREGKIKGMYIVGENPVLSFPQLTLIGQTLASLDFLVVQDMFLTETAKLATVVFPAASFAEKEGTFTNFEGRVQKLRKAFEPTGDSLPDWDIILKLASRMNYPMTYSSPQQAMDEVEEVVAMYQGNGYTDVEIKSQHRAEFDSSPLATGNIRKRQFPNGFGRFSSVEYIPQRENSGDEYPFTLLAGTTLYQFGTGSRSSRASRLRKFSSEAFVEISKPDAKSLGINHGDKVKVVSSIDEVTAAAKVSDAVSQGIIFMPMSFPESPINRLFGIVLDPRTKTPVLKTCSVRLERTGNHE